MALNGLFCADVPLRNYSLTHLYVDRVERDDVPVCRSSVSCLYLSWRLEQTNDIPLSLEYITQWNKHSQRLAQSHGATFCYVLVLTATDANVSSNDNKKYKKN